MEILPNTAKDRIGMHADVHEKITCRCASGSRATESLESKSGSILDTFGDGDRDPACPLDDSSSAAFPAPIPWISSRSLTARAWTRDGEELPGLL